jgi:hypothetical protein
MVTLLPVAELPLAKFQLNVGLGAPELAVKVNEPPSQTAAGFPVIVGAAGALGLVMVNGPN